MYGISFRSGAVVLQQGALPKYDDCMYYLQSGEAEVVISGGADATTKNHGEERTVEGHTVRILQKPGWLFGDVALLFHSPRTASVMAKTNITVWAMDRRTFLRFVMKHAQGARALRFLRKLPLLKGLSDNDLIRAASRMPQRMYEDGQPLIRIGERGDELFLIRYGKVSAHPF
jgi:CRP-like cAMP-binding protein